MFGAVWNRSASGNGPKNRADVFCIMLNRFACPKITANMVLRIEEIMPMVNFGLEIGFHIVCRLRVLYNAHNNADGSCNCFVFEMIIQIITHFKSFT